MSGENGPAGVGSLLSSAASGREDKGFEFFLSGDLSQMLTQGEFLRDKGFVVGQVDVYSALRTQKEYDKAITLIWEDKIAGWWHYRERLVELGVCTEEEFKEAI